MTRDAIFAETQQMEGGYVVDEGGPTKWGVTLRWVRDRINPDATEAWLRELDWPRARQLYAIYWQDCGVDAVHLLNPRVAFVLWDACFQHGPKRAIRWLQTTVGARPDGVLGPQTRAALGRVLVLHGEQWVMQSMLEQRAALLQRWCRKHGKCRGLRRRVNRVAATVGLPPVWPEPS